MLVSLAAGTILDADPLTAIEAAAAAGFDALGLRFATAPKDAELARLRERLDATGLRVLDVEVVRLTETASAAQQEWLVDVAAALDARFVLTVSNDGDLERTRRGIERLADRAAPSGVTIGLEYMAFTTIPDLATAAALTLATTRDNVAILVDVLHLARSGGDPQELGGPLGRRIGYVQVCDAPATPPGDLAGLADEGRHSRLMPGAGELPVLETLIVLRDRLDELPVSVEVQSDELAATATVEQRARLARSTTQALLDRARTNDEERQP